MAKLAGGSIWLTIIDYRYVFLIQMSFDEYWVLAGCLPTILNFYLIDLWQEMNTPIFAQQTAIKDPDN